MVSGDLSGGEEGAEEESREEESHEEGGESDGKAAGVAASPTAARRQHKSTPPTRRHVHRAPAVTTIRKKLLKGSVRFRCLCCNSSIPQQEKNLKNHRTTDGCLQMAAMRASLDKAARQAPKPLSADQAHMAASRVMRSGI